MEKTMPFDRLADLTTDAARAAIVDLLHHHRDEDFYYISLICSGSTTITMMPHWCISYRGSTPSA
jgi:hypothetical protein